MHTSDGGALRSFIFGSFASFSMAGFLHPYDIGPEIGPFQYVESFLRPYDIGPKIGTERAPYPKIFRAPSDSFKRVIIKLKV